jgi:hypothetical protein
MFPSSEYEFSNSTLFPDIEYIPPLEPVSLPSFSTRQSYNTVFAFLTHRTKRAMASYPPIHRTVAARCVTAYMPIPRSVTNLVRLILEN